MIATRSLALCALLALAALFAGGDAFPPAHRQRRQLADDNQLQPLEEADMDEQLREKRKLEGVTQAKFGIKNAVLGFVFGEEMKQTSDTNIRYQHNDTVTCHTQPNNLESGTTWRRRASPASSWSRSSRSTAGQRETRQVTEDDIPEFDRNKVSLQVPGSLFGPSVSLLIRTTKIIGDVVQNSAVRYQTFLRLFRPLFRGPFEIKGLDPPTTTTTTTTTTTPRTTTAQPAADNEVRRR